MRPPGKERFVRLRSLGDAYTEEAIRNRILGQRRPASSLARPAQPRRVRIQGSFRLCKITWKGLRALYYHYLMNQAQFHTRVETETTAATVDGQEVTQTTSTLYIHIAVESMTYLEGAALYRFDAEQREMLAQLMDKEYNQLWAALLDVDLYGGLTYTEWTELPSRLPAGDTGSSIAAAALSKVGTAYSVMDCSQLTQYAYGQAGITLPRTSVEQAKYCYNNGYAISSGQLQPGDLIFWSKVCTCGRWNEIHHTGIYIGDGRIVDASSSEGAVA